MKMKNVDFTALGIRLVRTGELIFLAGERKNEEMEVGEIERSSSNDFLMKLQIFASWVRDGENSCLHVSVIT